MEGGGFPVVGRVRGHGNYGRCWGSTGYELSAVGREPKCWGLFMYVGVFVCVNDGRCKGRVREELMLEGMRQQLIPGGALLPQTPLLRK